MSVGPADAVDIEFFAVLNAVALPQVNYGIAFHGRRLEDAPLSLVLPLAVAADALKRGI